MIVSKRTVTPAAAVHCFVIHKHFHMHYLLQMHAYELGWIVLLLLFLQVRKQTVMCFMGTARQVFPPLTPGSFCSLVFPPQVGSLASCWGQSLLRGPDQGPGADKWTKAGGQVPKTFSALPSPSLKSCCCVLAPLTAACKHHRCRQPVPVKGEWSSLPNKPQTQRRIFLGMR